MCVQAGVGALIGLPGTIANQPYTLTALARGGSEIGFTTCKDLRELLEANPALYPRILEILAAEVREMRHAAMETQANAV
jgi:CRP-like cAMP-binding protein